MESADEHRRFLSVLTLGEIRLGVAALPQSKKRTRLETWLLELQTRFAGRILPIDEAVTDRWGWIGADADANWLTAPVIDALLAATALEHNLTMVTRNASHFAVPGLNLINSWEYSEALDCLLQSAVNEFNDEVRRAGQQSPLRKLGGMAMLSPTIVPNGESNFEFVSTRYPSRPISQGLKRKLLNVDVPAMGCKQPSGLGPPFPGRASSRDSIRRFLTTPTPTAGGGRTVVGFPALP
jgi:predicted nucleic acid-binding protein